MRTLQPSELQALLSAQTVTLLDVRGADEWEIAHLPGALHIPMDQVPDRLDEIRAAKNLVVICHHGIRSERVARFLERNGIDEVANLAGGLHAWAEQIDPSMPRY